MSAQPDLFADPAPEGGELVVDLRERSAWRSIPDPRDEDRYLPGVVESICGRYTITWSEDRFLEGPHRYAAFRRQFKVDHRTGELRRTDPLVIGGHDTPEQAREACAVHAEGNP